MQRLLVLMLAALLCAAGAPFASAAMVPEWVPAVGGMAHTPQSRAQVLDQDTHVQLRFAVAHRAGADAVLQGACKQTSDPASTKYGQHWTIADLADTVASRANLDTTLAWLSAGGIRHGVDSAAVRVSQGRDAVTVDATVAQVEALMAPSAGASFRMQMWVHSDNAAVRIVRAMPEMTLRSRLGDARIAVRDARSLLPAEVAAAVDVVLGLTDLPPLRQTMRHNSVWGSTRWLDSDNQLLEPRAALTDDDDSSGGIHYAALVKKVATNSTVATVMFGQRCGDGYSKATPVPCGDPGHPSGAVKSYTAKFVHADGSTPVMSHADSSGVKLMPAPPGAPAGVGFYSLDFVGLTPFKKVHVEMQPVFADGTTGKYEGMAYHSSVPAGDQFQLPTPALLPNDVRSWYGYGAVDASTPVKGNSQAVIEFGGNSYSPADLQQYIDENGVHNSLNVTTVGPNNSSDPSGEGTLDVELIVGLAPNIATTYWLNVENNTNQFILGWLLDANNDTDVPLVSSISYGCPEDECLLHMGGVTWFERSNAELLKLCARGRTVVVASGDAGSTDIGHGTTNCTVRSNFPSSSPWTTVVSASQPSKDGSPRGGVTVPSLQGCGEVVVSIPEGRPWTTGGGIGNLSTNARPWYQDKVVPPYLTSKAERPPAGMFNPSGRGYPDVTSFGHDWRTVNDGTHRYTDGTSASAPAFAAAVSLINNARLSAGKSSVGFVNPSMYALAASNPKAFYDITVGENRCGELACCPYGWGTGQGWDAVTGLGSIGNFQVIVNYFMSLP